MSNSICMVCFCVSLCVNVQAGEEFLIRLCRFAEQKKRLMMVAFCLRLMALKLEKREHQACFRRAFKINL